MRDDHQGRPAVRARRAAVADGASALFADQPYKCEIIERVASGAADGDDAGEIGAGETISVYRNTPEFVDLCRGPHVPSTAPARPLQADEGGRRVLARQREGPDAAAHLRHGLGVEGRARPSTCTAWRRPRSATTASSPPSSTCCQLPERARRRPGRVAPEGRHRPQAHGGLQPRAPRDRRLPVRLHAAPGQRQPVRDVGPPRLVQGRHVPADGDGQRHVLPEADELPDALPDLHAAGSAATASCRCGCSSWARCTATSGPARCTA